MKIIENGTITNVQGFVAAGISAGFKKSGKRDLALIYSKTPAVATAVFTLNLVKAAPLVLDMEHIKNNNTQAIIINSGNANACTGQEGYNNALKTAELVAEKLGLNKSDVLVHSTGVIGVQLNMDVMNNGVESIVKELDDKSGQLAAEAIMTTDTFPKTVCVEIELNGKPVRIAGMSKGSGMIHPNMGTMLGVVVTDANIEKELLDKIFKDIVEDTYNMVSVDGDTSTNDMGVVIANSLANNDKLIVEDDENTKKFKDALEYVNKELAMLIAKDGEGATKLIEVHVKNARSIIDAKKSAKAVVISSLVKTAIFGSDANWGRILCAVGYSGAELIVDNVEIFLKSGEDIIQVAKNGAGIEFSEEYATKILKEEKVEIIIDLNDGEHNAIAWGCDLSYDYVRINADYRS
jgi:glutamate N-acetyltransferase/amino-acid N-acetyltransferase